MIQIDKIPSPREVETARVRRYPIAWERFSGTSRPTRKDLTGYECARKPRWTHQREKCAYCDRDVPMRGQPVEHFRPILGGYWWLTWDWDNLLFSCVSCNGAKGSQFPYLPGHVRLSTGAKPPDLERPSLVNPYDENPMRWVGFGLDQQGRWIPIGLDNDGRGNKIIEVLGLKQHAAAYTRWVTGVLGRDLDAIQEAIDTKKASVAQKAWDNFWARHDTEFTKFRSLTWTVANQRFPPPVQAAWGLSPRQPPHTHGAPPSTGQDKERTLLNTLTSDTRDMVYGLGNRASATSWDKAILAVLDGRDRWIDELVIICGATRETICRHLRRLEAIKKVVTFGRGSDRKVRRT